MLPSPNRIQIYCLIKFPPNFDFLHLCINAKQTYLNIFIFYFSNYLTHILIIRVSHIATGLFGVTNWKSIGIKSNQNYHSTNYLLWLAYTIDPIPAYLLARGRGACPLCQSPTSLVHARLHGHIRPTLIAASTTLYRLLNPVRSRCLAVNPMITRFAPSSHLLFKSILSCTYRLRRKASNLWLTNNAYKSHLKLQLSSLCTLRSYSWCNYFSFDLCFLLSDY